MNKDMINWYKSIGVVLVIFGIIAVYIMEVVTYPEVTFVLTVAGIFIMSIITVKQILDRHGRG